MAIVPAPRSTTLTRAVGTSAIAVATALAAFSGMSVGSGSKLVVILPLAAAVCVGLGVLALTRFAAYVMVLLVLRSSLDLAKVSRTSDAVGFGGSIGRALDPASILALLFLLTAGLWLAAQRRQRGALPGSSLRRALLAYSAAAVVSITGAANLGASGLEVMRLLAAVVMFVVLEQLMADRATMQRLLLAAYLSTLFPLAFTAIGFLIGHPRSEVKGDFTRITGPFNQSNTFGRYLMLMIVFGVALAPHLQRRWRLMLTAILAVSSGFLLLTYTRTALIGTVLGLAIVGLIQSKRLLVGLVLIAVCAILLVPQLSSRLGSVAQGSTTHPSSNTLDWRLRYWSELLPLAGSNPVTGIGLGMAEYSTEQEQAPHNDFLGAYVETGLLGLGAYLAMLAALVGLGFRAVKLSPPRSFDRGVGAGLLGCAVAFIAASLFANVLGNVVNLWYLFTFAAAAAAIVRRRQARAQPMDLTGVP
jgi:putative inorganic carbon (hco3(-)) transporter